jgi:hypothetical protein
MSHDHTSDPAVLWTQEFWDARYGSADQIAASLDPAAWQIVVAAAPARQTLDPDGRSITIRDAVLRARRRN